MITDVAQRGGVNANHKVNYELRELHKINSNNDSCH